jgi:hypothetical protein
MAYAATLAVVTTESDGHGGFGNIAMIDGGFPSVADLYQANLATRRSAFKACVTATTRDGTRTVNSSRHGRVENRKPTKEGTVAGTSTTRS